MRKTIARLTKPYDERDDLVSETITQVLRRRRTHNRYADDWTGYAIGTARNLCRQLANAGPRPVSLDERIAENGPPVAPLAPSEQPREPKVAARVVEFAQRIPSQQRRDVLHLIVVNGRSATEVARMLGCRIDQVHRHVREILREARKERPNCGVRSPPSWTSTSRQARHPRKHSHEQPYSP